MSLKPPPSVSMMDYSLAEDFDPDEIDVESINIQEGEQTGNPQIIVRTAQPLNDMENLVIIEDDLAHDILRHRILLTYEAEAENITPDDILKKIFDTIEVP